MALGLWFLALPPFLYLLFLFSPSLFSPSHSDGLHVVGGQHALLAGAGHAAVHPALVDPLHVHNLVAVHEGHLIVVSGSVVIDRPVPLLWETTTLRVSAAANAGAV